MTRLPRDVDYKCLDKILRRLGWKPIRQRGSHVIYKHIVSKGIVVVPKYREYSPNILLSILAQASIDRNKFLELYEELC